MNYLSLSLTHTVCVCVWVLRWWLEKKRRATFKYWHDPLFRYIRCLFFFISVPLLRQSRPARVRETERLVNQNCIITMRRAIFLNAAAFEVTSAECLDSSSLQTHSIRRCLLERELWANTQRSLFGLCIHTSLRHAINVIGQHKVGVVGNGRVGVERHWQMCWDLSRSSEPTDEINLVELILFCQTARREAISEKRNTRAAHNEAWNCLLSVPRFTSARYWAKTSPGRGKKGGEEKNIHKSS